MAYKSFDQRWKEQRAQARDSFRYDFDKPEKVKEYVEKLGRRADERLPGLYALREKQRANVEVLKIVGGEPLSKAEEAFWETQRQIEYDEPWQMLRDCVEAKFVRIEITTLYVHFEATGYRNRRVCRLGPHDGLEFGQAGKWHLTTQARQARTALRRSGHAVGFHAFLRQDEREIVVDPANHLILLLTLEKSRSSRGLLDVPAEVIERLQAGYRPADWEELLRLSGPEAQGPAGTEGGQP